MKNIILLFVLMTGLSFAQRPPDERLTYSSAVAVNDALNKAMAAITGSGVANQIAYFTGTGSIGSLATATYPNLTELARLKGITAPIQTQLNSKQATLIGSGTGQNVKTVNGQSIVGTGNITVSGASDTTGLYNTVYTIVKSIIDSQSATIKATSTELDAMIDDYRKNDVVRLNK